MCKKEVKSSVKKAEDFVITTPVKKDTHHKLRIWQVFQGYQSYKTTVANDIHSRTLFHDLNRPVCTGCRRPDKCIDYGNIWRNGGNLDILLKWDEFWRFMRWLSVRYKARKAYRHSIIHKHLEINSDYHRSFWTFQDQDKIHLRVSLKIEWKLWKDRKINENKDSIPKRYVNYLK